MFFYPKFDKSGKKTLTQEEGLNANMLMDINVFKWKKGKKGKKVTFLEEKKEIAVMLTEGKVRLTCASFDEVADRKNLFEDMPTTAHVCKNTSLTVEVIDDCEFIYLATTNDRVFPPKIYHKDEVIRTTSCEGLWENTAVREVNTVFDYSNAPHSNLVIGEVLARQGRWWSYLPHSHPQPEVYYYKFERKEGFGACFIGDEAHTVKDGSVGCFEGGKTHVQVTAPGFPMYCCWMIRHLDGNVWDKTRIVDPRYAWLED